MRFVDLPAELGLGWWQWRARLKRDPCSWCNVRPAGRLRSIEHITPRSQGGADEPANIVGACMSCNSARSDTTLLFWLLERPE